MGEIIAIVYAKDNKCIKDTETLFIHKIMIEWLKKVIPHLSVNSLYKLPAETKEHLLHFAQIAYLSLSYPASKEGSFSLADKEISYVNLQVGHSSLDLVNNFGLVLCSGMTVHRFLHEIVQEFLAAFYLSSLPQDEQISFYYEHLPKSTCINRFLRVCLFHFGLTRLETELFLNPSKIILAGMIESLAHVTQKQEGRLYLELQKLLYACLYEAQDETLVKTFCQQYTPLMEMAFNDDTALEDLRLTTQVAYVIVKSEIDLWEVNISDEKFRQKTDALVFPISSAVTDRIIKVTVTVRPNQSAAYIVKPIFKPKQPKRTGRATEMMKRAQNEQESEMYFQHAMVCTGQRETLHRVTQLYSPVTVRSDAGDPAYASLITCECVEQKLQDYVVFEPIHPIHTVQLSSKSRKTKGPDGERDATTWKHVEETHKKNYLEIIVLNKPSVKSITFQPPGSAQQCRLVMSSEKVSPCVPGRITMEAEKSLIDPTNSVRCMPVEESGGTSSSMVAHGLPLPKSKTKVEADKINILQTEETAGVRLHDALEVPVTAAQAAPSHKHFQDGDFNLYTPVPAQAESTEKVTWRPGMIMFTTMPDVFQKHKTYTLPVEDHQIRRGGNGQIFAADYFGYSLVAKKTLFRTREYNIIMRLNHSNIVPLLALMVGEVSHRKRFFCYHMLPRMSGDVARMLSDHPELTLAALKKTHSEDPRQFGLALGNMRYLLAEVLKGLAYMHDLHIVHRDVKASNILVRFHCQHENLLWCTCTHKYTVCVCDFDAAVELGEDDEMLPISQSNQVYYLPPVGTQGFRSPEGSQLVVASHCDVIAPRLTPRSDVWSLGVLMLRLFVGEDGPNTQRQNAILLLKYHQLKGMREGKSRAHRLVIPDRNVDKLLKLPILKTKLAGVSNLVDFVTVCLQLDPEQRPTAKDLLKHSFLY
jgi:serine/threonine protein kinase